MLVNGFIIEITVCYYCFAVDAMLVVRVLDSGVKVRYEPRFSYSVTLTTPLLYVVLHKWTLFMPAYSSKCA
jgi:hypothetical protein